MRQARTVRYAPGENESLGVAIVRALSEAKGRDISEDECALYENVDVDALDEMFREEAEDKSIKVEFVTHDAVVVIWGSGQLTIQIEDLADRHEGD